MSLLLNPILWVTLLIGKALLLAYIVIAFVAMLACLWILLSIVTGGWIPEGRPPH